MPDAAMPKSAIVFAAGLGTRMRPLTDTTPKPLIELCGKPIIAYTLEKLATAGIERVVVNTHYKAEQLHAYLEAYVGLEITISHEEELLNTGGGLLKALPLLGEVPFFVINGDIVWLEDDMPVLARLAEAWSADMRALLLIKEVEKAIGYEGAGDFDCMEGELWRKPGVTEYPYVFTGVQLFDPILLRNRDITPFSLSDVYAEQITEGGKLAHMHGLVHDAAWLHIGTPEGVAEAEVFLAGVGVGC